MAIRMPRETTYAKNTMAWKDCACRTWLFQKDFKMSTAVKRWLDSAGFDESYQLVFGLAPKSKPPQLGESVRLTRTVNDAQEEIQVTVQEHLHSKNSRGTRKWKWYCLVSVC